MNLAKKIQKVSQLRGLELKKLAEIAGIPYNTLRGYTQTEKTPSAPTGLALARALNVDVHWLFDDSQSLYGEPPAYVPPPPPGVWDLFAGGVDWEEIETAIVTARHEHHCKLLSRRIAMSQGDPEATKTLQEYFKVVRELFAAAFERGDMVEMIKLGERRRALQQTPAVKRFIESVWPGKDLTAEELVFKEWRTKLPRPPQLAVKNAPGDEAIKAPKPAKRSRRPKQ